MADSTGTSSTPDSSSTLASLSGPQMDHWRLTGELPSSEPATADSSESADTSSAVTADSAPVEPVAQAPSTEGLTKTASEAVTPPKTTPKLAKRHEELDTEIASLHEKLRERQRLHQALNEREPQRPTTPAAPTTPADSAPATVPLDQLLSVPDLSRPPLDDREFFAAYPDASVSQLITYRARYEMGVALSQRVAADQHASKLHSFTERRDAAIADDPAFVAALDPRVRDLVPVDLMQPRDGRMPTPGPLNLVAQEIYESPHAIPLMRYLSEHPTEIDAMQRMSPREIVRAMGRLEARVTVTPPQPVVKTTTSAPTPPRTNLGRQPAPPADAAGAALAAGDFARYMAEKNRQEVAS